MNSRAWLLPQRRDFYPLELCRKAVLYVRSGRCLLRSAFLVEGGRLDIGHSQLPVSIRPAAGQLKGLRENKSVIFPAGNLKKILRRLEHRKLHGVEGLLDRRIGLGTLLGSAGAQLALGS